MLIMTFKDKIAKRVVDYYIENGPISQQITHTMAVAACTRIIAKGMGMSERECELQESAAWLHDIGCPASIRKYGNAQSVNQQKEGQRIVTEWKHWLLSVGLTEHETTWIADVIGTHHQQPAAQKLHFEPLFEADLIVNLQDGYYGRCQAEHFYETLLMTEAGKALYTALIFDRRP